jgi:hypothetical protein
MRTIIIAVAVLSLTFVACEKKSTEGATDNPAAAPAQPAAAPAQPAAAPAQPAEVACCDAIAGMSVCVDFPSKSAADAECASFEGTVKIAACPTDGLAGSCKLSTGATRNYYKTGGSPNDTDYAKGHCANAMGGTFTPPK